ncbi:nuclear pore glycoprotein p62-like isoform X2 [Ptychodera flava]|uniref:nuclear pore glycoprotein p62-like isoform X2 n=1 Tax=Ptychodera flava TaxID=63121 RepID=UPI00396A5067
MFSFASTTTATSAAQVTTTTSGSGGLFGQSSTGGFSFGTGSGGTPFSFQTPVTSTTTNASLALSSAPATGATSIQSSGLFSSSANTGFGLGTTSLGNTVTTAATSLPASTRATTILSSHGFTSTPVTTNSRLSGSSTLGNIATQTTTTSSMKLSGGLSLGGSSIGGGGLSLGGISTSGGQLSGGTTTGGGSGLSSSGTTTGAGGLSSGGTTTGGAGLSLGGANTPAGAKGPLFTSTTTTTTSGLGVTFGAKTTSTATTQPATTSTTGLLLGHGHSGGTTANSGLALSTSKSTSGGKSTTTTHSAASAGTTMNYRQLEEAINKWTVDLEDQEKVFLIQATQVNAWDRLLIDNGEKIKTLHTDVEKVKVDQQRLEHELDFILSQQRELDDILKPLEEAIKSQQGSVYAQHADLEREDTYQTAENIDSQLKRMSQDLREIIEHVNNVNLTSQDADDPIQQISKILNAHMDSLLWVDQSTAMLQRKVDEITKQNDVIRKQQERSFHLAFE